MKIYFATDHAGFTLKNELIPFIRSLGHEVEDCGALVMDEMDDYPTFIAVAAKKLSEDVRDNVDSRAILLGGSGQGEAIVANRFKGVRAVVYYGQPRRTTADDAERALDIVALTREHNNSNALSLGARFLQIDEAKEAVRIWLELPFGFGARHVRRLEQLEKLQT